MSDKPATKWDFILGCVFFVVVNVAATWFVADYRWRHSPEKMKLDAEQAELDARIDAMINRPSPILHPEPLGSQGSPAR